ncbi:MAG: tol-pal system protein YbgF [Proteobacteria bacterium]|nr:tol-pal system protein YbgF [Pseudomonadota bacterium]
MRVTLPVSKTVAGDHIKHFNLLLAGVVAAAIVIFGSTTAFAQSSEVRALVDRINRLELDLNDVQRQLYTGATPAPRAATPPSTSGVAPLTGGANQNGLAILSQKIAALETEQRRLTGIQEEATFKIDQISSRLDKLVKDVDFRLTEIERQLGGGGAPIAPAATIAPGQQSGSLTPAPTTTQTVTGDPLPSGSKVLGTLKAPESSSSTAVASIAPTQTDATAAAAASSVLPAGTPADQYNYAISLVRADQYDEAEAAFAEFLAQNKDHELAGNAQYWLGETFYVRGDFPNAASAFFEGYQNYPDNSKAADNLLKLAMTLGRMDQKDEACATFEQINKQFSQLPARLVRTIDREKQKIGCAA